MSDDRTALRQALLESQRERADRIAGLARLAGRMAHDFNNVLMGIQPFAEVLARQNPDNPGVQKAVERIGVSIQRGKQLTGEVLAFTRQRTLVRKPIAARQWIDEIEAEARQILGTTIEFHSDVRGELVIDGDRPALQQTLRNLIANARDAMAPGGLLCLEVERGSGEGVFPFGVVENVAQFAHLTMTDNGSGLSPESKQHLFEPLFTTKRPASGMGLALAYQIVRQHGGAIFVESEEGRGTAVHLFLPLGTGASC